MHSVEGGAYSVLLPFLPFARHQERDNNRRDKGCGEE
jgi:hypothetical protein